MSRQEKIQSLLDNSDRKDLPLYEFFLNQKSDKQLDGMLENLLNKMDHVQMEANFN